MELISVFLLEFHFFFSFGDSVKEPKDVFLAQRKLL